MSDTTDQSPTPSMVADWWRQIHFALGLPLREAPSDATAAALRQRLELIGEPFPEADEDLDGEPAEARFDEHWIGSPHHHGVLRPRGVVYHHLNMPLENALARLTQEERVGVSYHCIIGLEGTRYRLVSDHRRTWHTRGEFRGERANATMLGVAFVGNTETGKHRFAGELSQLEIESAIEWLEERWDLGLSLPWITHHGAIDERDDLSDEAWRALRKAVRERFGSAEDAETP